MATNELDREKLSDEEALKAYKKNETRRDMPIRILIWMIYLNTS